MARVERWMTQYQFDAFRWVRRLAGAIDRVLAYENPWNNVLRKRRYEERAAMGFTRGGPGLETSQVQGATTQNAHRSPEDSLGKCAAGQAQGTLPSTTVAD